MQLRAIRRAFSSRRPQLEEHRPDEQSGRPSAPFLSRLTLQSGREKQNKNGSHQKSQPELLDVPDAHDSAPRANFDEYLGLESSAKRERRHDLATCFLERRTFVLHAI